MLLTPPDRWANPKLIDHFARVRVPWDTLTRRIVRACTARWLPPAATNIVEIGAGGGQLREWLPPKVAAGVTHTEPSEPFLGLLRSRHPEACAVRAEATSLPFPSSSVDAVIALCVLDTLPDLAAARDEFRRVLRPGGSALHFLDLSTSPDCLFPERIARGELPLTNFVCDPALLEVLTDAQMALLPCVDEFDDVLVVKWEPFRDFVSMLEAARHPLTAQLDFYGGVRAAEYLDPRRIADGYMAASADPARLLALNTALLKLTLLARQMGREWPLESLSSRACLREKLTGAFAPMHGFTVEFTGPVSAHEIVASDEPAIRFVLRHIGRTLRRANIPMRSEGTTVEELEGRPVPPHVALPGMMMRETTVDVFVARKANDSRPCVHSLVQRGHPVA